MTRFTSVNGRCCRSLLALAMVAAGSTALHAQTTTPAGGPATSTSNTTGTPSASVGSSTASPGAASNDGYSWIPGTRRGYVGINLGRSDYGTPCGLAGNLRCDDPKVAGKVYSGGMFNDYVGAELGYVNMGRADRAGGRTGAQGLNASVVGRVPFGAFNAFAKGGVTYGRTEVSALGGSGIATGSERGWGASYGAGLGYDFNPKSGIVLEWERHDFRFRDIGKRDVDMTTVGYVHRF